MEKYRRLEKQKTETEIQANEIRITTQGKMRSYISYATNCLQQKGATEVILKAMGRAINKTVTITEIIKRRVAGLHQNTVIDSTDITDVWEPLEEGLERVETTRQVSSIQITLSTQPLNIDAPGYQPPLPDDQVKALSQGTRPRRGRGRGGRGRYRGLRRGGIGRGSGRGNLSGNFGPGSPGPVGDAPNTESLGVTNNTGPPGDSSIRRNTRGRGGRGGSNGDVGSENIIRGRGRGRGGRGMRGGRGGRGNGRGGRGGLRGRGGRGGRGRGGQGPPRFHNNNSPPLPSNPEVQHQEQ